MKRAITIILECEIIVEKIDLFNYFRDIKKSHKLSSSGSRVIDRYFVMIGISSEIIVQCKDRLSRKLTGINYDKKINNVHRFITIVSIIDRDQIIFIRVLYFTKLAKYSSYVYIYIYIEAYFSPCYLCLFFLDNFSPRLIWPCYQIIATSKALLICYVFLDLSNETMNGWHDDTLCCLKEIKISEDINPELMVSCEDPEINSSICDSSSLDLHFLQR